MSRFGRTLNYASVNEDWCAEAAGLQLRDGDRVLCITGSGDRPLDLLYEADCDILAIDLNPAQNALLQLKIAAMRDLEFEDYTRFLGLEPAPRSWRVDRLARLELDAEARAWCSAHSRLVARGILYQGRWERHYRRVAAFGGLVRPRGIARLFSFTDVQTQAAWVREHWDTPVWRAAWWLASNRSASRLLFGDPAFFAHLDVKPAPFLYRSFERGLQRHLARDSFMAALALTGRLLPHALPPYLRADGVERIRPRLGRIRAVSADLITHLEQTRGWTRMSLSDVPSFCDRAQFERLLRGVVRAGADGARVVIRQFMTRHPVPPLAGFVREPELERDLARMDRAFCYSFIVGVVRHRGVQ